MGRNPNELGGEPLRRTRRPGREWLSASRLRRLPEGMHADGGGLYLAVSGPTQRSWIYRYHHLGKEHQLGLGSLLDVTLPQARARAAEYRQLRRSGVDPATAKAQGRAVERAAAAGGVLTFRRAAERCIEAKRPTWRSGKHASQWRSTLRDYAHPVIGDLPVTQIRRSHVLDVLRPIWSAKTETAKRVQSRIAAVIDWCIAGESHPGPNPAAWGPLKELLGAPRKVTPVQHFRSLPYPDAPAMYAALREREGIAARCLELTLLTACRVGSARAAEWSEFDLKAGEWLIPGSHMKAGEAHRVPLPRQVVEMMSATPRITTGKGNVLAFPAPRGGVLTDAAISAVLKRMGWKDLTTIHGLRATFRSWAADTGIAPHDVLEQCLAHAISDKTVRPYQRGEMLERRRTVMQAWADFVTGGADGNA